jgi:hypothetical protein
MLLLTFSEKTETKKLFHPKYAFFCQLLVHGAQMFAGVHDLA